MCSSAARYRQATLRRAARSSQKFGQSQEQPIRCLRNAGGWLIARHRQTVVGQARRPRKALPVIGNKGANPSYLLGRPTMSSEPSA